MLTKHFILATVGHVDHGKSSLVKAITGIDPDRLPEEKARGITIDLGFAHLDLPAAGDRSTTCRLGVVDVPGHKDFVKNMVAGVGSVDVALLVVAADDGWMPQTEEHLQILVYLGVTRAVIALTKADLTAGNEVAVIASIREHLCDTPFAHAPIVPTSIVSQRGLDELRTTLATVLAQTPAPPDLGKPRLSVDRAFALRGIGTVVTGTLLGGTLATGQSVVVQPGSKGARIRSLQSHSQDLKSAGPGTRAALNLTDLAVSNRDATGATHDGVQRGDVVTLAEFGPATDTVDVLLLRTPRLCGKKSAAARPIKNGTRVRLHHGSGNVAARLCLLDQEQLGAGESALAQLRLESPLFALVGDRFIVRDWSEQTTLTGGIVLDAEANRREFRRPPQREFLTVRALAPAQVEVYVTSQLKRDRAAKRSSLLLRSNFAAGEIAAAVERLAVAGSLQVIGDIVAEAAAWKKLMSLAAGAIDTQHRTHPEQAGLLLSQLRFDLQREWPAIEILAPLVDDLCRNDFVKDAVVIRRTLHRPSLPPELQAPGARLRRLLGEKPFAPPSRKELAPDALSQKALRFLRETGEVIELSDDVVLLAASMARMSQLIGEFIRARGPATPGDLRQHLATTRRIIIPLLERLDRDGLTLRQGELRALRVAAAK